MRTVASPPFLRPPSHAIDGGEWTDRASHAIADHLTDWDPHTDLSLQREVVIDLTAVRETTLIGPNATLVVIPSWASSRTRLSAAGAPIELGTLAEKARFTLELAIPGRLAGGRLDLKSVLALRQGDPSAPAIAARRPGAVLWSDIRRVVVEGSAARFPVTAIRFSTLARAPVEAGWFLDWHPDDLAEPATSAVRLLVNADRDDVLAAIRTGSSAASANLLQSFMRYDVARALIQSALGNDEFIANSGHWDEETLGRLIDGLLEVVWPGIPAATLRERAQRDPARIDAQIQAAFSVAFA